jgi:hypothetical protein
MFEHVFSNASHVQYGSKVWAGKDDFSYTRDDNSVDVGLPEKFAQSCGQMEGSKRSSGSQTASPQRVLGTQVANWKRAPPPCS